MPLRGSWGCELAGLQLAELRSARLHEVDWSTCGPMLHLMQQVWRQTPCLVHCQGMLKH